MNIVSKYINLVRESGSMEAISELIHNFDLEIIATIPPTDKTKPGNCKNKNVSIAIFEIISVVAIVYMVLKKK